MGRREQTYLEDLPLVGGRDILIFHTNLLVPYQEEDTVKANNTTHYLLVHEKFPVAFWKQFGLDLPRVLEDELFTSEPSSQT